MSNEYQTLVITEGSADDVLLELLILRNHLENRILLYKGEPKGSPGFVGSLEGLITVSEISGQPFDISKIRTVVVVADNDNTPENNFKELQKYITNINKRSLRGEYGVPSRSWEIGKGKKLPDVAIMMLPEEGQKGSIESLCLAALNKGKYKNQSDCVDNFVGCIGADKWNVPQNLKIRVQSLLSSICEGDPYTSLRYAWSNDKKRPGDIFDLDSKAFKPIVEYLKKISQ
jgi:hypothetical protein